MAETKPVRGKISVEGISVEVSYNAQTRLGHREGSPAQLGKRLICAQEVGETDKRYVHGQHATDNGVELDLGCGTEVLVTKPSGDPLLCCGMEMTLQTPQKLPSSD